SCSLSCFIYFLLVVVFFFVFFFSSRRRHTRSKRDWSSDVCSSDLGAAAWKLSPDSLTVTGESGTQLQSQWYQVISQPQGMERQRSEERRVGKEGRSRRVQDQKKKKTEKIETEIKKRARTRRSSR